MTTSGPLRLALVGRGRAANALVPRWLAAGHRLLDQRARDDGPLSALAAADVVVVAVTDAAIASVAATLATRPSARDEIWIHLSGSLPAALMRVGTQLPRAVAGMHPLVALTGAGDGPLDAIAGVEGEAAALSVAERLARDAGLTPIVLDANRKMAYHAAAVTVAGHATALFAQALTLMGTVGIGPEDARRALQPLFASAAQNLVAGPPEQVSTGPVVRGDLDTIAGHLAALAAPDVDPDIARTYRLLAKTQLGFVAHALPPDVRASLVKLLDE